jgi:hypothetical protein
MRREGWQQQAEKPVKKIEKTISSAPLTNEMAIARRTVIAFQSALLVIVSMRCAV